MSRASAILSVAVLLAGLAVAGCGNSPVSPTSPDNGGNPSDGGGPQQPVPPVLTVTKLLAFGDSMTEGVTSPLTFLMLLEPAVSYPTKLQARLLERYTAQPITVTNGGLGGERAESGVARLPAALQAAQPELVLLMEGVNDLNTFGASAVTSASAAVDQMVKMCRAQNRLVLLAGIPPQRPGGSRASSVSLVSPYNDRLRQVAVANGVEFVDVYAAFGGDLTLLGSDGLHPNAAGYDRIAQAFYDRIVALYERPAKSLSASLR